MIPDVGAGPMASPLTAHWILALLVLWIATIGAGVIGAMIWRWFTGPVERDEQQTAQIGELRADFSNCRIQCAERRIDYVRRDEYEARMIRVDHMLTRVHKRIDQIALKLGVPDEMEGD